MRKKKGLSLLLVGAQLAAMLCVAIVPASAATVKPLNPNHPEEPFTYEYNNTAPMTKTAPVLDGKLTDACWTGLDELPLVLYNEGDNASGGNLKGTVRDAKEVMKITWDSDYLYVAVTSKRAAPLTTDAGVAFFFDPSAHRGNFLDMLPPGQTNTNAKDLGDIQFYVNYNAKADPANPSYVAGSGCTIKTSGYGMATDYPFPKGAALEANTKSAMTSNATGDCFVLEVAFRWEDLMINPQDTEYFAMNVFGNDVRWAYDKQIATNTGFWSSTDKYGKITLSAPGITGIKASTTPISVSTGADVSLSEFKFTSTEGYNLSGKYFGFERVTVEDTTLARISNGNVTALGVGSTNLLFKLYGGTVLKYPINTRAIPIIKFDPIKPADAYALAAYTTRVAATNTADLPIVYSVVGAPAGLTIDATSGVISWTPTDAQVGTSKFKIQADVLASGMYESATKTADISINVLPASSLTVEPIDNKLVQAGVGFGVFVYATTTATLPATFSIKEGPKNAKVIPTADSKPNPSNPILMDQNAYFKWTPAMSDIGKHHVVISVTNGSITKDVPFDVTVSANVVDGVTFTQQANVAATVGDKLNLTMSATSSTGAKVTYSALAMPAGAAIDATTGKLTWTIPESAVGANTFTIKASDGTNGADMTFVVTVKAVDGGDTDDDSGSGGGYHPSYGGGGFSGGSNNNSNIGSAGDAQNSKYFNDIGKYTWAASSIDALFEYGIIKGITADTYDPGRNISRGDFTVLMMRTFKFQNGSGASFADVKATDYYANEIAGAKALGLITGTSANLCNPKAPISRQDMAVMTVRALELAGLMNANVNQTALLKYSDADQVSDYATLALANMVSNSLLAGNDGMLMPHANASRAEVAVLLNRMIMKYGTSIIK